MTLRIRLQYVLLNVYLMMLSQTQRSLRWKIITNDRFVRVWKKFAGVDVSASAVQSFVLWQWGKSLEILDVLARDGEETGTTSLQVSSVKPYCYTESAESDVQYKGSSVQATWRNSIAWACVPFMHTRRFSVVVLKWRRFKHSKPKPVFRSAINIYLWRRKYRYLARRWAPVNRR